MNKIKILILAGSGFLILDRATKWFFLKNPEFYSGRFIDLKFFGNKNLFFLSLNPVFLNLLIGLALFFLFLLFFNSSYPAKIGFSLEVWRAGLCFIIFGGLSNFFDRLYFDYVIDWIKIFIFPASFFNIADIMIIAGILILTLNYFGLFVHPRKSDRIK